jgi:hypothetical protein
MGNRFLYSFLLLTVPPSLFGGAKMLNNMPSECSRAQSACGCQEDDAGESKNDGRKTVLSDNDGDGTANECIKVWLGLGRSTPWTGSVGCSLKIFADDDSWQEYWTRRMEFNQAVFLHFKIVRR